MGAVLIVGAAVFLPTLLWVVVNYNRFVCLKNHIAESWADIDVELKRRYDLIPHLVQPVKGYAAHEREVLERVTELRNKAKANEGSFAAQAADETNLLRSVKSLFTVVEAYPELKSNQHFLELQEELALTEDRIAAAGRFFNGNVRDMRQLCEMFPTSILAGIFHFDAPGFFELASDAERVVPRV